MYIVILNMTSPSLKLLYRIRLHWYFAVICKTEAKPSHNYVSTCGSCSLCGPGCRMEGMKLHTDVLEHVGARCKLLMMSKIWGSC